MRIHHIATRSDWEATTRSGTYTTSTVGRSLDEVGYIHAARREQVEGVFRRHYADVREPLLLLTIDTDRLTSPWSEDPVGDETFPHIHGPLDLSAVVEVQPLGRKGAPRSLAGLFLEEMGLRMGLAIVVMALAFAGARIASGLLDQEYAELAGAAVVLVGGSVVSVAWLRRRG